MLTDQDEAHSSPTVSNLVWWLWIAAGEWELEVQKLAQRASADMLCETVDLTPQERTTVLTEFNAGQAHITTTLFAKMSAWKQLPLSMLALAHPQEEVAKSSCRKILLQVQHLRSVTRDWQTVHSHISTLASFEEELQSFAGGSCSRLDLPVRLQHLLAQWCCMKVVETSIEGKHSLVKCRLSKRAAAKPSGPLFSTELRFNEFKRRAADKHVFRTMLHEFESCRESLCYVVDKFGFTNHQHLQHCLDEDGRLTTSVFYHMDAATNFTAHSQTQRQMQRDRAAKRKQLQEQHPRRPPACSGYTRCVWKAVVDQLKAKLDSQRYYGCVFHSGWQVCTFQERCELSDFGSGPLVDAHNPLGEESRSDLQMAAPEEAHDRELLEGEEQIPDIDMNLGPATHSSTYAFDGLDCGAHGVIPLPKRSHPWLRLSAILYGQSEPS